MIKMMKNCLLWGILAMIFVDNGFSFQSPLIHRIFTKQRRKVDGFIALRGILSNIDTDGVLDEFNTEPANVEGKFSVNDQCIGCNVCRWMCPSVFKKTGFFTAVAKQPETDEERIAAYQALLTCPTGAIQSTDDDYILQEAIHSLPREIDPISIPGVMHTGYHSEESYSCTPYFIKRDAGNVMIDCPRYNNQLAQEIEKLGGIHTLILTHDDDIPHHQEWKKRFPNLIRVMHSFDAPDDDEGGKEIEVKLTGFDKWYPDNDIEILFTSGHSAGSISILYETKNETVLFSGDHLAQSHNSKQLTGFRPYNHGHLLKQVQNLEKLLSPSYQFNWLLPAHGRWVRFANMQEKNRAIKEAITDFCDHAHLMTMFTEGCHEIGTMIEDVETIS